MIYKILLFIVWYVVWLLLIWPPDKEQFIIAAIVSAFVSLVTLDTLKGSYEGYKAPKKKGDGAFGAIKRIPWFFIYIAVFIWECVKANADVAFRVIHPALPIRPGTIKVKTSLKSDVGLTFLANSITLTPGNTSIDIDKKEGYIYIHLLNIRKDFDVSANRLPVVDRFENILRRMFE